MMRSPVVARTRAPRGSFVPSTTMVLACASLGAACEKTPAAGRDTAASPAASAGTATASPTMIRDSMRVASNGTRLYVDVRGDTAGRAILLFLHGGPAQGFDGLITVEAYVGPLLEPKFVVAYLHQRGVLRSPAVPESTQTVETHVSDVDHTVEALRQRFPGKPVVVMGHSWGGLLAADYALAHPQSIAGLVLMAAPLSFPHNERASYDSALAWATRTKNDTAIGELRAVGPPPHADFQKIGTYRKWAARSVPSVEFQMDTARVLAAGGFARVDSTWFPASFAIAMRMLPHLLKIDISARMPTLHVPLLAIAGAHDAIVMPGPMMQDLATYGGPKRLVIFEKSDHFLFMEEPERLAKEITSFVDALPSKP